jgi:dTDP-4-dehydrorhamnose reductase
MRFNILITGANGQLGSEIRKRQNLLEDCNFYFTDIDSLDITDEEQIKKFVKTNDISSIINCAAFTAVDLSEKNIEQANLLNNIAVSHLAKTSLEYNLNLVHISTDYVFDGNTYIPYKETDKTNPCSVYGKTKLDGENEIIKLKLPNSIIIRTSWLYSEFGNNFVKTMMKLGKSKESIGVVFDQVGSPTFAGDLAEAILRILPQIDNKQTEIYHFSNEGVISWYDFAKAIFYLNKYNCKIKPIHTKDYPTLAKRPHFSVLDKSKIKAHFDLEIPHWFDSLKNFLSEL